VTICVKNKREYFGNVNDYKMILNKCGQIARQCWLAIPEHFPQAILDEFIIMPNHVHGIIQIDNAGDNIVGNKNFCSLRCYQRPVQTALNDKNFCSLHSCSHSPQPWQTKLSGSLSSIIRGFKIGVTKWFRHNHNYDFQWQKSFYDHIIRKEQSLYNIRQYIRDNPLNWQLEKNNPYFI
jgi:REP element-mobilizing transposase RayT